ncbi:hypothetical protein ScPMuIL_007736 [Solemya velum]
MTSFRTQFAVVDQALKHLKTVEDYLNVGMDTTSSVATDLAETEKDVKSTQMKDLEGNLISYLKMERDLKQFLEAVEYVKQQASDAGNSGLEILLDKKLTELKKNNDDALLTHHEKFKEFKQRVWEAQHTDEGPMPQEPQLEDEDIALTQQEVNTRCPYTGKEMKIPVRNKICNHNYDKDGIQQYMKNRGRKAKCPVSGCGNTKPVDAGDLEENKELKRFIERKNKKKT